MKIHWFHKKRILRELTRETYSDLRNYTRSLHSDKPSLATVCEPLVFYSKPHPMSTASSWGLVTPHLPILWWCSTQILSDPCFWLCVLCFEQPTPVPSSEA